MVSLLCLLICSHFSSWAQDSLCNFRVPDRVPAVGVRVHSPSLPAAAPLSFPGSYFHPFPPQHHPQALPLLVSKFWIPRISLLPPSAFEWGRRGPLDAEIKEERGRIFKINTSFLRRPSMQISPASLHMKRLSLSKTWVSQQQKQFSYCNLGRFTLWEREEMVGKGVGGSPILPYITSLLENKHFERMGCFVHVSQSLTVAQQMFV